MVDSLLDGIKLLVMWFLDTAVGQLVVVLKFIWNNALVPALSAIKTGMYYLFGWLRTQAFDLLSWLVGRTVSLLNQWGVEVDVSDVQDAVEGLYEVFADLDWILPITACVRILVAAYGAVFLIRMLKWAISLRPKWL
jgi:hypothetical protein